MKRRALWQLLRRNGRLPARAAKGHERPFATALRHARMTLVNGLHHEKLIRRQSNTSPIPQLPTA